MSITKKPTSCGRALWRHKCCVADLRLARGLTTVQLAEELGLSSSTVSIMERGGDVRLSTMRRVSTFFDKSLEEIWPT